MDYANSFGHIVPELVLTGAALALLLVSAFAGDKASRLVSILAAVALGGAGVVAGSTLVEGTSGVTAVAFGGLLSAVMARTQLGEGGKLGRRSLSVAVRVRRTLTYVYVW